MTSSPIMTTIDFEKEGKQTGYLRLPHSVRSEISGRSFEEEASVLIQERQPSQAFVTPEQIGSLCLYLMSMAAASVTGMAIPIDGAWTAQ